MIDKVAIPSPFFIYSRKDIACNAPRLLVSVKTSLHTPVQRQNSPYNPQHNNILTNSNGQSLAKKQIRPLIQTAKSSGPTRLLNTKAVANHATAFHFNTKDEISSRYTRLILHLSPLISFFNYQHLIRQQIRGLIVTPYRVDRESEHWRMCIMRSHVFGLLVVCFVGIVACSGADQHADEAQAGGETSVSTNEQSNGGSTLIQEEVGGTSQEQGGTSSTGGSTLTQYGTGGLSGLDTTDTRASSTGGSSVAIGGSDAIGTGGLSASGGETSSTGGSDSSGGEASSSFGGSNASSGGDSSIGGSISTAGESSVTGGATGYSGSGGSVSQSGGSLNSGGSAQAGDSSSSSSGSGFGAAAGTTASSGGETSDAGDVGGDASTGGFGSTGGSSSYGGESTVGGSLNTAGSSQGGESSTGGSHGGCHGKYHQNFLLCAWFPWWPGC